MGDIPLPVQADAREGAPTVALEIHGVLWAGFEDLLAWPHDSELARLEMHAPDGVILNDYKTTKDIARYALTPAHLEVDIQAASYTIDVCRDLGIDRVPARWAYFETLERRRAHPVDAMLTLSRALDVMGPASELAKVFDQIERSRLA